MNEIQSSITCIQYVQALELLNSVRIEVDKYENKDTKIGPATAELTKHLLELEIQLNKKSPRDIVHAADPDTVKVRHENSSSFLDHLKVFII